MNLISHDIGFINHKQALVVSYSSGTPTSSGSAVGRHQQHHPPASPEIGTPDVKGDRDYSSLPGVNNGPQQGGVGGINVIRASGIRVIRESPSSSGDFTAKLNQIPVNPFPSSQYLLAVPKDDEPVWKQKVSASIAAQKLEALIQILV